jgi:hypothetical protein
MKKVFILFLKKRGIYASYRKYVRLIGRYEIKKGIINSGFIRYSLNHEKTKEGIDFWRKIDNEWFNFYRIKIIGRRKMKDFYHLI